MDLFLSLGLQGRPSISCWLIDGFRLPAVCTGWTFAVLLMVALLSSRAICAWKNGRRSSVGVKGYVVFLKGTGAAHIGIVPVVCLLFLRAVAGKEVGSG